MKIISWNVNGIRAISKKREFWDFLEDFSPDILALQEVKSEKYKLSMDILQPPGGYFAYFNCAKRPGYSGVAIYSKKQILNISQTIGIKEFDEEGRFMEIDFGDFILFNVYFPNGGSGELRLKFKLDFYDKFLQHILDLKSQGKGIIVGGDFNTAHTEIDLARPKENESISGFMPIERHWVDKYLRHGLVDIFRQIHPDKKNAYTWWSMRTAARVRNIGWRIDYFLITSDLMPRIKQAEILSEVIGSDHCPILLEIEMD